MNATPPRPYPGLCAPFTQSSSGLFPYAIIARRDPRDVRWLPAERPVRTERASYQWQTLERAEFDARATWIEEQTLIRPVPAAAGLMQKWPGQPGLVGWTPPHWKPSLFALGWRAGTDVRNLIEPDFYADAPDSTR